MNQELLDQQTILSEQNDSSNPLSHRNLNSISQHRHFLSSTSINTTPNHISRSNRTPLANKRDRSQHSSIRKSILSETINKKEEDLLKRLNDLQGIGMNQNTLKQSSNSKSQAQFQTANLNQQKELNNNYLYSTYQGVRESEREMQETLQKSQNLSPGSQNKYSELVLSEYAAKEEDQNLMERLRKQYLQSPKEIHQSPKLPNQIFMRKQNQDQEKQDPLYQLSNYTTNQSESIQRGKQYQYMQINQEPSYEQQFLNQDYANQKLIQKQYQPPQIQPQNFEDRNDKDLLEELEEDKRMYEEIERELDSMKLGQNNHDQINLPKKKKVKRGLKQKQAQQYPNISNINKIRSPRQSQPLSPQQRQLQQYEMIEDQKKKVDRKRWDLQEDQIMFNLSNNNEEQWMRINDILAKHKFPKIQMEARDNKYGPVEQSVLQTLFSLTTELRNLQKRVERGDYDELQRLDKDLNIQRDMNLKQEQTIFIEFLKSQDKREYIDTQQSSKKYEKQLKDMKNKMQVSENLVLKKQMELDLIKQKLEKRMNEDEKYLIRSRGMFEKHFGKQARAGEEKYVNFLKMYETQREKQEKQLEAQEREIQRLTSQNLELENENYALSRGQMPASEAHYFKKGDGWISLQLREQEDKNYKLQEALKKSAEDFKDLLREIDKLKQVIKDREQQMGIMEQEMKQRPNLSSQKATQIKIQNMEQELSNLQKENDSLNNEIMILRNEKGGHIKSVKSGKDQVKGGLIVKKNQGFFSAGDAKLIIEEILDILKLETDDPVQLIETVRKLEKVVKAVPRMENFIQNISKQLGDDQSQPLPIEQVIPKLQYWRDLVLNQTFPLQQFKRDLTFLLFQRENIQLQNMDLLKEVERLFIDKEHFRSQLNQETESQRALKYILELFEVQDPHSLIEKVNQTFIYVNEFNAFMKIVRGILRMDQSVTVTTCLSTVRNIVMTYNVNL